MGQLSESTRRSGRKNKGQGKECLVAFVSARRLRVQGPSARVTVQGHRLLLNIVDKIHNSSRQEEHRERSPELLRMLKEDVVQTRPCAFRRRGTEPTKKEKRKGSKSCFLCGDANQVTKPTPWRGGATLFFRTLTKHWQVGEELQEQEGGVWR